MVVAVPIPFLVLFVSLIPQTTEARRRPAFLPAATGSAWAFPQYHYRPAVTPPHQSSLVEAQEKKQVSNFSLT